MDNWNFVNYDTIYSSDGTTHVNMGSHACFSSIFGGAMEQNNHYVIHLYKGLQHMENTNGNNAVLVDYDTVVKHLNILKRIVEFNYVLDGKVDQNMHPYYELTFDYSGSVVTHDFILTWIRYLYEFPYALFIKEVYKLKEIADFQFINPIMLFGVISSLYDKERDIHSLFRNKTMYRMYHYNDIRDRLEAEKNNPHRYERLQSVFNTYKRVTTENNGLEMPGREMAFWDKPIEERIPIYKERIKLFKQIA